MVQYLRMRLIVSLSLVVAFLLAQTNFIAAFAQSSEEVHENTAPVVRPTPSGLYGQAWRVVRDQYHDPSFKGQDWGRWQHAYDGQLTDFDDARVAIATMLASLDDKYTRYLPPEACNDEKAQINYRLCGIGVYLGLGATGKLMVIDPIPHTPAFKAGICTGDEIIEINGNAVPLRMDVQLACNQIRGRKGTRVKLTILRGRTKRHLSVTRDEIAVHCVYDAKMIDDAIGYIKVNSFIGQGDIDDIKNSLHQLSGARGIVLDLRNNPGGLLLNAIGTCSLFLKEGTVVSSVDRVGEQASYAVNGQVESQQDLVILVNRGTASAAEIVAAALQDHGRCALVGTRTHGKGLVQSIVRLPDGGALNLTIMRYFSPNGSDINLGVTPQDLVETTASEHLEGKGPWFEYTNRLGDVGDAQEDKQLARAIQVLNAKLDRAPSLTGRAKRSRSMRFDLLSAIKQIFRPIFRAVRRLSFGSA